MAGSRFATAARPDILIVDEVLSIGDACFQTKCFSLIADCKRQGTTLLLVFRSAGDIVKHCDRAIFLKMVPSSLMAQSVMSPTAIWMSCSINKPMQ
ncbi:MAG: hypothetical protein GPOALKHO_000347 [Sodalis sp.]|nr:MAG: hypothetical protein GPOALKHO_000347 [Sodalis sp.]